MFVIDSKAQTSNAIGLPKWEPRSRVEIYLGHSPIHAGSVALVFNPRTLHVSPQFHVVFDDSISTVPSMLSGAIPSNWDEMVKNNTEISTYLDFYLTKVWSQDLLVQDEPSGSEGDKPSQSNQ